MTTDLAADYVEKRLTPRERTEPEALARLASEARLLRRLGPLGVTPRLLAQGTGDAGPWLRTERVDAPTLRERLEQRCETLAPDWIERAMRASLLALATLHEARDENGALEVVHADLSPSNLAIDDFAARAFVLDLDLAWWREGPRPRDGAFRGTIRYAAPELARGEPPTVRSDLFALGAVLLHAATGLPPREGSSFAAMLANAAEVPILRPELKHLAHRGPYHAAMLACLRHEPAERPSSARSLLEHVSRG